MKIKYASPCIEQDDINAVAAVMQSGWLTQGPKTQEYEEAFAERVGAKYAVACSSGTAALHLACMAVGVHADDHVVIPPITFVATRNAVNICGTSPQYADVDVDTLLVNPVAVRGFCVRVFIPVDYAGQPCSYDDLYPCAFHMVADACHSLGATYKGKPVGSLANITCFSTHAIKSIATGEGGMCATDDGDYADYMREMRQHNRGQDSPGYNYRLTEMQAALGISQLKKLDRFLERRQEIADRYRRAFANVKGISCLHQHSNRTSANHLFVIVCDNRDRMAAALKEKDIETRVHYPCLSPDCPVACRMAQKILSIPIHCMLSNSDVDFVIEAIKEVSDEKMQ